MAAWYEGMNATTAATVTKSTTNPRCFRATYAGTCAKTGVRFQAGAEIYKNPDGWGYVLHVVKAPVGAPAPAPEASVSALEAMYRGMDWTYEFSDSYEVHRRGDAAMARMRAMEDAVVAAGLLSREEVFARRCAARGSF